MPEQPTIDRNKVSDTLLQAIQSCTDVAVRNAACVDDAEGCARAALDFAQAYRTLNP